METVFKVGDKVFDIRFGWGKVIDIKNDSMHPIYVEWLKDGVIITYTYDGKWRLGEPVLLSFTEYGLKGLSQERPKEEEKFYKGQVVYVSNFENPVSVVCGKFLEKKGVKFVVQLTAGCCDYFYCWSKNPLIEEKEEKKPIKMSELPDISLLKKGDIIEFEEGYFKEKGIDPNKEFEPEIGKFYYFWDTLKNRYFHGRYTGQDDRGRYCDDTGLRWNDISETNPLDK